MRITKKVARDLVGVLDTSREKISKETKEILERIGQVYDFAEYERRRKEVEDRINDFPSLVKQAVSMFFIALLHNIFTGTILRGSHILYIRIEICLP